VALFAGLAAALGVVLPAQDMIVGSLITLAAALLAGWLLLKFAEKKAFAELGFGITARTPFEIGGGLLIPVGALLLVTLVLVLLGALRYGADSGELRGWLAGNLGILLVLLIPAAAEEALFRGYPFQKLVAALGPVAATVLASAGFAIAHRHNPGVNTFALINIFLAGVMLSIAFLRTRSLWFATAVHLGWNWQMAGPLDLPVSGLELFDTPLYEPRSPGAAWLTGGSFGPEGGLAGLLALLLVTAAVWHFTKQIDAQA
jgi:membrane protease YdiL (CAAX protease family)